MAIQIPRDFRRVIVAASVGNVIEWYDFYIFGSFHPRFDSIFWSIASTECGEISSSTSPGICGDDTVSICISST